MAFMPMITECKFLIITTYVPACAYWELLRTKGSQSPEESLFNSNKSHNYMCNIPSIGSAYLDEGQWSCAGPDTEHWDKPWAAERLSALEFQWAASSSPVLQQC